MRGGNDPHDSSGSEDATTSSEPTDRGSRSRLKRTGNDGRWSSLGDVWGPKTDEDRGSAVHLSPPPVDVWAPTTLEVPLEPNVEPSQTSPTAAVATATEDQSRPPATSFEAEAGTHAAGGSDGAATRSTEDASRDLSRLARGGSLNFVGAVANGVFGFLLVIVVTHGLVPQVAGVFFESIALFSIISNVVQLGADDGLVRTIPRLRALGRTQDLRRTLGIALWPVLAIASVVGVVAFVFAPQVSHLFVHGPRVDPDALVPYIRIMAPFLPLWAASNPILAATRGFGTMLPTVVVDNVGKPGLRPVLAFVVISGGLGATALALSWAALVPVGTVVAFIWLMRLVRRAENAERSWRNHRTAPWAVGTEFWRFSLPRAFAAAFSVTVYWLDTLLLGALKDTRDAAIYTAASRYLFLAWFALGAVQQVIAPMISRLITEGNRERAQTVYQTGTQWLMIPSWPVLFSLAVFAPFLLRVFRPGYVAGQHALLILSLAMLINSAAGPVMVTLLMAGKSTWALLNSAAGLLVNLTLNLLLIPHFGMVGAALAWASSMVVINVAALAEVSLLLKLRPFGSGAKLVAVGSFACYGLLGLVFREVFGLSIWSLLGFGVASSALYLGLLWRFKGLLHFDILRQGIRLRRERLAERGSRA